MNRAKYLRFLLEQTQNGGNQPQNDPESPPEDDMEDGNPPENGKKKPNNKEFIASRSRFSYTSFNKCDCTKKAKDLSDYCRKYCNK